MAVPTENKRSPHWSASKLAKIAGLFYVLNTITSMYSYFGPQNRLAFLAGLLAAAAYVVVTILFYFIFKPVNRNLSLLAASIGMAGNVAGVLSLFHRMPVRIDVMVFFAAYCLLIGFLIAKSAFFPQFLGWLMSFAGIGYLTYVWPPFAHTLFPYNVLPGALGEWTLTVWLLVKGLDQKHWEEQATLSNQHPMIGTAGI